jgi:hypothetical protein
VTSFQEIHEIAFGQIGLLPYEYYTLLPDEFISMTNGYLLKRYIMSHEHRHATFISVLPFFKDITFERFCREMWPLDLDKKYLFGEREQKEIPMASHELWTALKKHMSEDQSKKDYEDILKRHDIRKRE